MCGTSPGISEKSESISLCDYDGIVYKLASSPSSPLLLKAICTCVFVFDIPCIYMYMYVFTLEASGLILMIHLIHVHVYIAPDTHSRVVILHYTGLQMKVILHVWNISSHIDPLLVLM